MICDLSLQSAALEATRLLTALQARGCAGNTVFVNVTAVDAFGNRWLSGNPQITATCATCATFATMTTYQGRTDFVATFSTAGSPFVQVSAPGGAPIANVTFTVRNALVDAARSALTGPTSFTAGDNVTYEFVPRDSYGNLAMRDYTSSPSGAGVRIQDIKNPDNTATFTAQFRRYSFDGVINSLAMIPNAAETALNISVYQERASVYALRVVAGALIYGVRPSINLQPITVAPNALNSTTSYLTVRVTAKRFTELHAGVI